MNYYNIFSYYVIISTICLTESSEVNNSLGQSNIPRRGWSYAASVPSDKPNSQKGRRRVSRDERRAMVESFVNKYFLSFVPSIFSFFYSECFMYLEVGALFKNSRFSAMCFILLNEWLKFLCLVEILSSIPFPFFFLYCLQTC